MAKEGAQEYLRRMADRISQKVQQTSAPAQQAPMPQAEEPIVPVEEPVVEPEAPLPEEEPELQPVAEFQVPEEPEAQAEEPGIPVEESLLEEKLPILEEYQGMPEDTSASEPVQEVSKNSIESEEPLRFSVDEIKIDMKKRLARAQIRVRGGEITFVVSSEEGDVEAVIPVDVGLNYPFSMKTFFSERLGKEISSLKIENNDTFVVELGEDVIGLGEDGISSNEQLPHSIEVNQTDSENEPDDLTKILGISPIIQEILNNHGIRTYGQLAFTTVNRLHEILDNHTGPVWIFGGDIKDWPSDADILARKDNSGPDVIDADANRVVPETGIPNETSRSTEGELNSNTPYLAQSLMRKFDSQKYIKFQGSNLYDMTDTDSYQPIRIVISNTHPERAILVPTDTEEAFNMALSMMDGCQDVAELHGASAPKGVGDSTFFITPGEATYQGGIWKVTKKMKWKWS
ncbi:MAG: hypothetical protein M3Q34_00155 [bacterium]|nr:hypothetical protein [bacterium]